MNDEDYFFFLKGTKQTNFHYQKIDKSEEMKKILH